MSASVTSIFITPTQTTIASPIQDTGRPQCGGEGLSAEDDYDLPLHIAAVFIVLVVSFLGCAFPIAALRRPSLKIPPSVFFICKHFGTGVLVATAFVHLLPTAFSSLNDPCLPPFFNEIYPAIPGVLVMVAMFSLFAVEMVINHKAGGHTHGGTGMETNPGTKTQVYRDDDGPYTKGHRRGGSEETLWVEEKGGAYPYGYNKNDPFRDEFEVQAMGPPVFEMRGAEMPAWFHGFYNSYVAQINTLQTRVSALQKATTGYQPILSSRSNSPSPHSSKKGTQVVVRELEDPEQGDVDPEVLKRMSLGITILEGGILFHSIFVGLTLSVSSGPGFLPFLIAILFHQAFEGLGLGSRIAAVPFPRSSNRPWYLALAFGLTTPIGMAIGLGVRTSFDPASAFALIMTGSFNAISAGLLVWAGLVSLLFEDFIGEAEANGMVGKRRRGFFWVSLGAVGMSIVGAFA